MAQQTVNIGAAANDGTGDTVRTAGTKINANFTELYAAVAASGASWKLPVRVASTADGALATAFENGDTIDGVVLVTGDRILLKNQTAASENGIYVVAATGAPVRAGDADAGGELVNAAVLVSDGTVGADKLWVCTANAPITVGTTALAWVDMTPAAAVTASPTEILTGTDVAKTATPDNVAALWEQGANIASAGTIAIGEGGYFHVTGTTAITDIDPTTDKAGRAFRLVFDGILTLTNGASLILPTGANITTAAGDAATFISEGTDVVRCVSYTRASGAALTSSAAPDYQFGLFFTTAPTASEVLLLHIAAEAFTIPANFATPTSKAVIGTNPTASFAIDVQRQVNAAGAFATIGTITISTGGAYTFATASGTSKAIAVNDVLKFIAPGSADATAANAAITIRGTR